MYRFVLYALLVLICNTFWLYQYQTNCYPVQNGVEYPEENNNQIDLSFFYSDLTGFVFFKPKICRNLILTETPQTWTMNKHYGDSDITYTSHSKIGFFDRFSELTEYWDGPIVITVFLEGKKESMVHQQMRKWKDIYCNNNIFERTTLIFLRVKDVINSDYPINELRNIAWNYVKTEYMFVTDLGVIPPPNKYNSLKQDISKYLNNHSKNALIIPVFKKTDKRQVLPNRFERKFPLNKEEVVSLYNEEILFPYSQKIFPLAHAPTNYSLWCETNDFYYVKYQLYYEPYIIVRTDIAIRFWETFSLTGNFHYSSWILELALDGFQFIVNPDFYIINWSYDQKEEQLRTLNNLNSQKDCEFFIENINKKQIASDIDINSFCT